MNEVGGNNRLANIILTDNNTIEVQSGDVVTVGYYHPSNARYRVRNIPTDGYIVYHFNGPHESVDFNNATESINEQ